MIEMLRNINQRMFLPFLKMDVWEAAAKTKDRSKPEKSSVYFQNGGFSVDESASGSFKNGTMPANFSG